MSRDSWKMTHDQWSIVTFGKYRNNNTYIQTEENKKLMIIRKKLMEKLENKEMKELCKEIWE